MGIANYMAKEVMKEIGNKSREFYEFILPPVDMILQNDSLIVTIDMPGFDKKVRLPIEVKDDEDLGASAKYRDGVLTFTILVKTGKNITVE